MDAAELSMLVPLAFFWMIAAIVKIVSDNRTKRKLIDGGVSEEFARTLFAGRRDPTAWAALKWGLVVAGLGLALIIAQFLPYDFEEPIAYGLMFLFAGAGLLIYYIIARRQEHRHDEAGISPPHTSLSEREPVA